MISLSSQSLSHERSSESTSDLGHEDKRAHGQNAKNSQITTGQKGGRKSGSNEDGQGKNKEIGKAARRKEQNRAAQKAFRERREAKVHDVSAKALPYGGCT